MPDHDAWKVVLFELALALNGVFVGLLATTAVERVALWPLAPVVVVSFAAAALSDRHREGYLALVGVGVVLGAVVLWTVSGGPSGVLPAAVSGFGLGIGANRFVFGVVRPLPPVRRQRGFRTW